VSAPVDRLSYCVTCGHEVDPYPPGSLGDEDVFVHGMERPPDEYYRCPRCGPRPAPFMEATGQACGSCAQLVPFTLVHCGYCGTKLR